MASFRESPILLRQLLLELLAGGFISGAANDSVSLISVLQDGQVMLALSFLFLSPHIEVVQISAYRYPKRRYRND